MNNVFQLLTQVKITLKMLSDLRCSSTGVNPSSQKLKKKSQHTKNKLCDSTWRCLHSDKTQIYFTETI